MAANILIVDDSATMRRMIRRTLEISDLNINQVYEASNGIEALACMDANPIDVVLLDINMPVMGGDRLIERIRCDRRLRNIPLIIASTEGSETRVKRLLEAGARGYLRKPFLPEQLRDVLAPIVGSGQKTSPAGSQDQFAF